MIATEAATRRTPMTRPRPALITAIASGKGGVGKTWLSATLASLWGRAGKRTLLIDGDLGLANVDVQLGVSPHADLSCVARGLVDLDGAVTPALGGAGRGGFDIICGRSGSSAMASLKLEEVHALAQSFRRAARHYDEVIVDLAAGVDPATLRLARAADRLLVVTTEEPTALTDAYAFIKLMRLNAAEAQPLVAVNMAEKRATGRKTYEQLAKACEKYLGFRPPLAGVIPRDHCVPDAIRAQTALLVRSPTSPALDEASRIAERLTA